MNQTRFASLAAAALLLIPCASGAAGPWTYSVTGPGGSSEVTADQVGQVLYFELDATTPDYVWGNVRVDFDPAMLECVSIEESPAAPGLWTAWVETTADPAHGGGGVLYRYDDGGLGSEWAQQWVADNGQGTAGPVASYDNALGIIRFYVMSEAGGQNGSLPLRIGFRIKAAGTAVFTTAANDWTAFDWSLALSSASVAASAAVGAEPSGYSWNLADLPNRHTSAVNVSVLPAHAPVHIEVDPGGDLGCLGADSGVLQVAVYGRPELDVSSVHVPSLSLEGFGVKTRGSGRPMVRRADLDRDGREDLVVGFVIVPGALPAGEATVTLRGTLGDGTPIQGSDTVCVGP